MREHIKDMIEYLRQALMRAKIAGISEDCMREILADLNSLQKQVEFLDSCNIN